MYIGLRASGEQGKGWIAVSRSCSFRVRQWVNLLDNNYDEFSVFVFENVHRLANMFEERVMLLLHDPADNVTPNLLVAGRVLP